MIHKPSQSQEGTSGLEKGTLYGIGVGPGDPELLTLKALRVLKQCNLVVYPAPDDGPSFARAIVAHHIKETQEEFCIEVPMKAVRFPAQETYDLASKHIASHLRAGHDVCVLCEGDPFFYGSFMYLYQRLSPQFPTQVVPGVSSLMASAATLGRPLAARNDILTIVPATLSEQEISDTLSRCDAAVIIKVGRHLGKVKRVIEHMGLQDCAAYLERIGLDNQKVIPFTEIDAEVAPYFSMVLVYRGGEEWMRRNKHLNFDGVVSS